MCVFQVQFLLAAWCFLSSWRANERQPRSTTTCQRSRSFPLESERPSWQETMQSVSQLQNERGRGLHLYFSWHSAEGKEQLKSGVSTVEQVLKIYLLGPNASSDWPGSARNVIGQAMRIVTCTNQLSAQPLTSPHSQFTGPPRRWHFIRKSMTLNFLDLSFYLWLRWAKTLLLF